MQAALTLLHNMVRVRQLEERAAELYGAGKIRGFLHLYVGQEAVAAGVLHALGSADRIVATYREHAHALLRGVSMNAIMAEMYGKYSGCSHGRGGSMHLFDRATGFFGGNAIVGSGLAVATGLALAERMQGGAGVTVCFFGEGAMAEGVFHESMNLAAVWKLPVLFVCENNQYAMGTALARSQSQTALCTKAASYAMPAIQADGMDALAVRAATLDGLERIRASGGPCFIECQTYRFRAHSMYDPELYRDKAEVASWKQHCPIAALSARLRLQGELDEQQWAWMQASSVQEVDAAVAFAEAADWEPVEDLLRDVVAGEGEPI